MRDDFDRVVIERARWGSRMRNLKTGWHTSRYDPGQEYPFPKTASSSWNWNPHRKEFSDRLGPLERFLRRQAGRPWRKVEAELRQGFDFGTVIGRHLWDHARRMVETQVRMTPDGRPRRLDGYPVRRRLYVHPRSGLLLVPRPEKSDPAAERRKRIAEAQKVVLDADVTAEKVKGLWFLRIDEHRTEEVVELRRQKNGAVDPVRVTRPVLRRKQANKEELRRIRAALERSL